MALRIAKWVGIAVAALVALLLLVVLGLNTAPGRNFVRGQLDGYETASGLRIGVGRLEGSLYGALTIRDLTLSDPKGVFARAPAVALDWRPFAYAHSKIDVRSLAAPLVTLSRLPALKEVPSDPNAPILPDIDLTIGRLTVDRLVLEKPVTGKRSIVRLAGGADIADGRARLNLDAAALRAVNAVGGDRLLFRLDAVPAANRLLIDARMQAPAGGLVDSYAGLGKPIDLRVGGRGDWANWRGQARALLGGQAIADIAILGRDGTFRAKGATRPGLILTGPAARLVEPALDVDMVATFDKRIVDTRFAVRSAALAVDGQGRVDLGQSRIGNFRIDGQLLRPGAIAPNVRGRDVRVAAAIDGPFATPTVAYRLTAAALGFDATGIEGLQVQGKAVIDTDRILIPVHATARRVTGLNAAAGGLLTNLRVDGDLAYANAKLLSDNLRLRSDRIDATAILLADIGTGRYTGALKGRVNDYQVDGLGRINLVTDADLVAGANGTYGIKGRVRVTTRRIDNASVRDALGGPATITADVGYSETGAATVRNLRMTAPKFRISSGEGSYRSDGTLAFRAAGVSADYGPVAVVVGGTVAAPRINIRASRPNVGIPLTDVTVDIVGTGAGYQVNARGGSNYGPFAADLLIRQGARGTAFDIRSARFAGIDLRGSVSPTPAGPYTGSLALNGSGLNGTIRLAAAGQYQRADVDVAARGARIPGTTPITIAAGTIRGSVIVYPDAPAVNGRFVLTGVRQGAMAIDRAQGRVNYRGGRGTVALIARGTSGVPFDIATQAALSPDMIRANIRGTANAIPFRLAAPAIVRKTSAGWTLAPATLVLPQGQMVIEGSYGDLIRGRARLSNLDLSIVQAFAPGLGLGGKASGTVDYIGDAGVPTLNARLDIARFTRTGALTISDPVDIATLIRLSDAGGSASAIVRRGGAAVGRLQARLGPLGGGNGAWTERLLAAPLSGGVRYAGPAEVLWTLTGIAGQTLSGPVAVAADFGGRVNQPTLTGVVRANALRYENETYGTVLSNIAVNGRFTQSRFELTSLTAKAGSGSVSASGSVGLDAAGGFPIDLRATLARAQLARSDALGATVSGTLRVRNGRDTGPLIEGDLTLPEIRYQIVMQGASEVAVLDGVRRRNAPPMPTAASTLPSNWKLNIRVRADNRIFVSGMGLEAEWKTDLRVTGTATTPRIVGNLEVLRGTDSFSGRRFEISRGKVTFNGGPATNPELDISATTTVEGVTAIINIGGSALNPQVTFTSTPALAQDEVLSRLLFGSSVTSLSPTQAIQLAAALNSLRGSGGGGLNPLGKLRSATGIDRLRILGADKTAGRGTALAAGQYISNDIYVEVITDARGFTATQLQIALSKSLSILSSTGSFGGSNVSLRYSKNY
ncbi:MAG TPA: translocation/assembly module TamB domain-containing protein [Sphingomonas sp.]|uniref:translocation/assembly module TamB domain-containing protein n=1 Tax=Sphingomonas sp. TaxID=28214 RepID=UPI002ED77129